MARAKRVIRPDEARQRMARILDDMEGLVMKPTDVARQARRLRVLLYAVGVVLPDLPPATSDNFGREYRHG